MFPDNKPLIKFKNKEMQIERLTNRNLYVYEKGITETTNDAYAAGIVTVVEKMWVIFN